MSDDSDVEIMDFEGGIKLQQDTIKELQEELKNMSKSNAYQHNQLQELLGANCLLKTRLEEQAEKQRLATQLQQSKLELCNTQITGYQQEIITQQKCNEEQSEIIRELRNELEIKGGEYIQEVQNLQQLKSELELNNQSLQSKCDQLVQENMLLIRDNQDIHSEVDQLSKKQVTQAEELSKLVEKYEEDINILTNKLTQEELLTNHLKQNVADLSNEIKMKWDNKLCVQQFNEKLLGENISNINKIEQLNSQIANFQGKTDKLIQQRDHFKQSFFEASNKILAVQKQQQATQQQLHQAKEVLQEKQEYINRNDNYMESFRKMQQIAKEHIEEIRILKQYIKQQQLQLEEQKKKEEQFVKETAHVRYQMNQQLQNQKMSHDSVVIQLNQSIDSIQVSLNYKEKYIENQNKTIAQLREELNRIESAYTKLLNEQGSGGVSNKQIKKQNQSILQLKQHESEKREQFNQQLKQI